MPARFTVCVLLVTVLFVETAPASGVSPTVSEPSTQLGRIELTEYLIAKPLSAEIGDSSGDIYPILPLFSRQSQFPQPVVIRNYYLTAQAKEEVLPFWQGEQPLRLRNQFVK